ncbi:MAG TPA: hypothetical protein VEA69_13660 [Tepidisphaeraceae bacterium]|nr:hypothetical protein [Tepidisphaeraceae bacterium]
MADHFIPGPDQAFLAWARNYSDYVTAHAVAVGLTAPIAVTLASKFTAFEDALALATNPATRGGAAVLLKDEKRRELEAYCRLTARAVQGTLTVTNTQRYDMGLTVRALPSPIGAPGFAPDIDVKLVSGNTVRARFHDPANPTRKGRPSGVAGLSVFSHVGPTPPTSESDWKFEGNATRTTLDVVFPEGTTPGAQIWLTAFYYNPRMQRGPAATPVTTRLPGGAAMAA